MRAHKLPDDIDGQHSDDDDDDGMNDDDNEQQDGCDISLTINRETIDCIVQRSPVQVKMEKTGGGRRTAGMEEEEQRNGRCAGKGERKEMGYGL